MGDTLLVLKLRFRQIWRLISTVGWLLVIALPILFIFFLVLLNNLQLAHPALIYLLAFLPTIGIHNSRKDAPFLKKFGYNTLIIFSIEYFMLALVVLLPIAILFNHWLLILLALPGALLIALSPMKKRQAHQQSLINANFLQIQAFEWIAGIRKNGWGLITVYILGLAGAYWVAPPLIAILLLSLILPSFYDYCEPKEWIEIFFSESNYLLRKGGQHALLFLLFLSPLIIAFLVFSIEYWYVLLITLIASLLYLFFSIFYKYANYYPGRRKIQNGTIAGLMALGLFLPFTAPVGIVYICFLFFKAQNRLQYYLNR